MDICAIRNEENQRNFCGANMKTHLFIVFNKSNEPFNKSNESMTFIP